MVLRYVEVDIFWTNLVYTVLQITIVILMRPCIASSGRNVELTMEGQILNCVVIVDQEKSSGIDAVAKLIKEFGKDRAVFLACDVTSEVEFTANFKRAIEICPELDILVNNAGILNEKRWELMIDVNYRAVVRGTLLALDYMGKHKGGKGGTILNVASITRLNTVEEIPIYSGTKSAVLGFSLGIKSFCEKTGVRILAICPGFTSTSLVSEIQKKCLDFIDEERVSETLPKYPTQPAETVAEAIVELIEKGENGATWVIEGNEPPYAVQIPHYSTFRIPICGKY
ncbi:15-hydroxyprostaglandin dehydrogenase [NAD(+)]-like isoform X2 [Belonocnema kinseyi]|uniref:15-hydroxyprostaglandin dehydrogenase [NAD(+)]-like isoform X2 n=1 Tax=Belonocnema kinseyi TaxID=2817044 RepID=UPI00143CD142|nr:15-hydroxyprostaglandin dehydrogenase [NAD(+)]-like isoform X2 [Belonocnema kinseyi]